MIELLPSAVHTPDSQKGVLIGRINLNGVVEFKGRRQSVYPLASLDYVTTRCYSKDAKTVT
jgi:hypothetical protein